MSWPSPQVTRSYSAVVSPWRGKTPVGVRSIHRCVAASANTSSTRTPPRTLPTTGAPAAAVTVRSAVGLAGVSGVRTPAGSSAYSRSVPASSGSPEAFVPRACTTPGSSRSAETATPGPPRGKEEEVEVERPAEEVVEERRRVADGPWEEEFRVLIVDRIVELHLLRLEVRRQERVQGSRHGEPVERRTRRARIVRVRQAGHAVAGFHPVAAEMAGARVEQIALLDAGARRERKTRREDRVLAPEVRVRELRQTDGRAEGHLRIRQGVLVGVPEARRRDLGDIVRNRHVHGEDPVAGSDRNGILALADALALGPDLERLARGSAVDVVADVCGNRQIGDQMHLLAENLKHARGGGLARWDVLVERVLGPKRQ